MDVGAVVLLADSFAQRFSPENIFIPKSVAPNYPYSWMKELIAERAKKLLVQRAIAVASLVLAGGLAAAYLVPDLF